MQKKKDIRLNSNFPIEQTMRGDIVITTDENKIYLRKEMIPKIVEVGLQ